MMGLRWKSSIYLMAAVTTLTFGPSDDGLAVVRDQTKRLPFAQEVSSLRSTMTLPLTTRIETVRMDEQTMETRMLRSQDDERVEPLSVIMGEDTAAIAAMAEKLALADQEDSLAGLLKKGLEKAVPLRPGSALKSVVLAKDAFELLDKDAFAELYAKSHHDLTVDSQELRKDRALRRELMRQLVPFLGKAERKALLQKILASEPLSVDRDLLPDFARKMIRKYLIFRGPNCFHAALAFHSPLMTSSSLINVKDEAGYHRAMINYDELWRIITQSFYEVDTAKVPLKYGDMIVFFDVPANVDADRTTPIDFRWIRHTATHLFNGYTFSKGSKSPNTPYTVRTLADEWKTWQRYTTNLGVKVFRRSQKSVRTQPPMDLADWMY